MHYKYVITIPFVFAMAKFKEKWKRSVSVCYGYYTEKEAFSSLHAFQVQFMKKR